MLAYHYVLVSLRLSSERKIPDDYTYHKETRHRSNMYALSYEKIKPVKNIVNHDIYSFRSVFVLCFVFVIKIIQNDKIADF